MSRKLIRYVAFLFTFLLTSSANGRHSFRSKSKVQHLPACALVRLAPPSVVRTSSDRAELAGLELALDVLFDLMLGRVRVLAPQLPGAEALELEDLQHIDEVRAGGHADRQQRAHQRRPAHVQVARALRIGDEAQRDRVA